MSKNQACCQASETLQSENILLMSPKMKMVFIQPILTLKLQVNYLFYHK